MQTQECSSFCTRVVIFIHSLALLLCSSWISIRESLLSLSSLSLSGAEKTLLDGRRWRELESQSSKSKSFIIFCLPFFIIIGLMWAPSSNLPINNVLSNGTPHKVSSFTVLAVGWNIRFPWRLHFHFSPPLLLLPRPRSSQIGSGIGRMILKEEMKARSGSYDNDPWGSARNSRSGSKETLNTTGYGTTAYNNTINGCKDPPSTSPVSPPAHLPLLSFLQVHEGPHLRPHC